MFLIQHQVAFLPCYINSLVACSWEGKKREKLNLRQTTHAPISEFILAVLLAKPKSEARNAGQRKTTLNNKRNGKGGILRLLLNIHALSSLLMHVHETFFYLLEMI